MMPGILQQMGADNLQSLRKLAEQLPAEARNAGASQAATAEDDEEGEASAILAGHLSCCMRGWRRVHVDVVVASTRL